MESNSDSKKRKRSPTRVQPSRRAKKDHKSNDEQKENDQTKHKNRLAKIKGLNSISCDEVIVSEVKLDCGTLASTLNISVKQLLNNSQPSSGKTNISNRFVLESGHKRKRDHDDSLFISMNIRPLSIALDRINVSKNHAPEQLKPQPQNKRMVLADTRKIQINEKPKLNEMTNIPSTRKQPSRKAKVVSIVPKDSTSSKSVNRKTSVKNKIVPFKNTKKAEEFSLGEIVLAHVTGFCDWPAFIKSVHGQILVVQFFGTVQVNPLRCDRIKDFNLDVAKRLLNRKGFKKAMKELEMCMQIPAEESIFY